MGHRKRVKVGTFSLLRNFPPRVLWVFFFFSNAGVCGVPGLLYFALPLVSSSVRWFAAAGPINVDLKCHETLRSLSFGLSKTSTALLLTAWRRSSRTPDPRCGRCLWIRAPLVALNRKPSSHRQTEEMQSAVIAWVASAGLKLSLILPPDGMMTLLILAVTPLAYFHLMLKAPNASLCSVTQMRCGVRVGWWWRGGGEAGPRASSALTRHFWIISPRLVMIVAPVIEISLSNLRIYPFVASLRDA